MRKTIQMVMSASLLGASISFGQGVFNEPKVIEPISKAAFLRPMIPENTIAYVRIPSIWGLFSAPNNRTSDSILANPEHIAMIRAFREKLQDEKGLKKLLSEQGLVDFNGKNALPFDETSLIAFILGVIDGPLELVVTDKNQMFLPTNNILATIPLSIKTTDEFNSRLEKLGMPKPFQLNSQGYGHIEDKIQYYFNNAEQRLYLYGGMKVSENDLKESISALTKNSTHPLFDLEKQIDTTGQNIFVWATLEKSMPTLISFIPPSNATSDIAAKEILSNIKTFAFGAGTNNNGQGQFKTFIELPVDNTFNYQVMASKPIDFKTIGTPRYAFTVKLPTRHNIEQLVKTNIRNGWYMFDGFNESNETLVKEKTKEALQAITDASIKNIGINALEFLEAIGPEMVIYGDDYGASLALRLQNGAKFNQLVDKLVNKFSIKKEQKEEITHLSMPNSLRGMVTREVLKSKGMPLTYVPVINEVISSIYNLRILDRYSHIYWSNENDWLFISTLPQPLMERKQHANTSIKEWFDNTQGYDADNTLLGATFSLKNKKIGWYSAYLGFLRNLNDELELNMDITQLPSFSEVMSDSKSRLGVEFNLNQNMIGMTVSYDISPMEASIYGLIPGVPGVAIVGILSMFALPAYQDYTIRTHVSEGMVLASGAKMAAVEFYVSNGRWPNNNKEIGLAIMQDIRGNAVRSVEIKPNGVIEIQYNDKAKNQSVILKATVTTSNGSVIWDCKGGTLAAKYRPASCR